MSMLLITGSGAAESSSLTISGMVISTVSPVADFMANQTLGNAPLAVRFTDLSTGNPATWEWDFENDGNIDDTSQNPVHAYTIPGIYTVSLTVRNAGGSDAEVKLGYITVRESDAGFRIQALKQYIQKLHISPWAKWFLTLSLDRALDQLEKGHEKPAINQMKVFIQFVELQERFRILTRSEAGYMIRETRTIFGLLQV
jgi:PKD repeat protein